MEYGGLLRTRAANLHGRRGLDSRAALPGAGGRPAPDRTSRIPQSLRPEPLLRYAATAPRFPAAFQTRQPRRETRAPPRWRALDRRRPRAALRCAAPRRAACCQLAALRSLRGRVAAMPSRLQRRGGPARRAASDGLIADGRPGIPVGTRPLLPFGPHSVLNGRRRPPLLPGPLRGHAGGQSRGAAASCAPHLPARRDPIWPPSALARPRQPVCRCAPLKAAPSLAAQPAPCAPWLRARAGPCRGPRRIPGTTADATGTSSDVDAVAACARSSSESRRPQPRSRRRAAATAAAALRVTRSRRPLEDRVGLSPCAGLAAAHARWRL